MKIRTSTPRSQTALLAAIIVSAGFGFAKADGLPANQSLKYSQFGKQPGIHKIESYLLTLGKQATKSNKSFSDLLVENARDVPTDEYGSPLIEVVATSITPQLRQLLTDRGVRIVHESKLHEIDPNLSRFLTISQTDLNVLEEIAALDEVNYVRSASGFKSFGLKMDLDIGSADGKAAEALNADILRNQYGVDGSDIRVGILSDSFTSEWATPNQQTDEYTASGRGGEYTFDFTGLDGLEGTFVVQTEADKKVTIEWEALDDNVIFYSSEIDYPIEEINCRNRTPLLGTQDKRTVTAIELDNYPEPSCTEGGDGFALFAFKVGVANPGDPTHRGKFTVSVPGQSLPTFSLRTDCTDLASELFCDVGEDVLGASGLYSQVNGNLPEFVTVIEDYPATSYGQVINEGTAMGELIYDLAPGADIGFHTAFISQASFAQGIYRLANYLYNPDEEPFFADIMVDDVIYYREPMYQDGIISSAISDVVRDRDGNNTDNKTVYFSAAGNSSNAAFKLRYKDVRSGDESTYPPEGGDLMEWPHGNGYLPITVDPGGYFYTVIQWNQPFASTSVFNTGAQIDLDAYITMEPNSGSLRDTLLDFNNYPGSKLFSTDQQGNSDRGIIRGDPYEYVYYSNTTDEQQTVYLAVDHFQGAKDYIPQIADVPLEVRVVFINKTSDVKIEGIDEADPSTGGPTMYGHVTSPDAIAVGAANYFGVWQPESFGPTDEIDPEPFTSAGGSLENLFDIYGGVKRTPTYKPDLTSVDGNSTSFFGEGDFDLDGDPNFFGTSAAAPNAAGVAALLLQMNPGLSPQQVRTALVETAKDCKGQYSLPGRDNTTGVGVIDALKAGEYVEDNYGIIGGPPASSEHVFNFVGGSSEGWIPEAASPDAPAPIDGEPVQGPPYTAPNFGVGAGGITMASPDVNTLGWWKSPTITASPYVIPGTISIDANPGSDSIFRAKYTISSDGATTSDVPTIRLRTSREEFDRSEVFVIVQNGKEATFLPTAPRSYITYFNLSPTSAFFQHYIDLLGFSGTPGTNFTISMVDLEALPGGVDILSGQTQEALLLFSGGNGNDYGWDLVQGHENFFGRISGEATENGLEIGGARDLDELACFGYWQSDVNDPIMTMEQNAFYRVQFLVSTNTPADQKTKAPALRLRLNTANFEWSNYIEINGKTEGSEFPVADEDITYYMYFETPDALVGQPVNFAFDYLYLKDSGKDPDLTFFLKTLRIDSFDRPVVGN